MDEWLEAFLALRPAVYRRSLMVFRQYCQDSGLTLARIQTRHLRSFQQHLLWTPTLGKNGILSTRTVFSWLHAVRRFLRWAAGQGLLDPRPIQEWVLDRPVKPSPVILTRAELQAALNLPSANTPVGLRDRAILRVIAELGIYPRACESLDLADLDLERRQLQRHPFGPDLAESLSRYLQRARPALLTDPDEKALFLSKAGKRLAFKTIAFALNWRFHLNGRALHRSWLSHRGAKRAYHGIRTCGDPTLDSWIETYLASRWAQGEQGQRHQMRACGLTRFSRFCRTCGLSVHQFQTEQLEILRQHLLWSPKATGEGLLAPRTVHVWLIGVRQFLRWAVAQGLLKHDPTAGWVLGVPIPPPAQVITRAELEAFLNAPSPTKPTGIRDRVILGVMCELGLFAEACRKLDLADLDLQRGLLKGRALGAGLAEVLTLYLERARPTLARDPGEKALFLTSKGARISYKSFQNLLLGRYGVSPTTLRRSWLAHEASITRRLPGI